MIYAATVVPFVRHMRRIIMEQQAMYMCCNTHHLADAAVNIRGFIPYVQLFPL